jgi:hypothetical protein
MPIPLNESIGMQRNPLQPSIARTLPQSSDAIHAAPLVVALHRDENLAVTLNTMTQTTASMQVTHRTTPACAYASAKWAETSMEKQVSIGSPGSS